MLSFKRYLWQNVDGNLNNGELGSWPPLMKIMVAVQAIKCSKNPLNDNEVETRACLDISTVFLGIWIPIVKIRWSWDRLIFNTLRPRLNGRYFADDTFERIFLNETFRFSIKI